MDAIKPHHPCNDKADDMQLKQGFNYREKLSFLESHMGCQALAKAAQRFSVIPPQFIKQRPQLLVFRHGALRKRPGFRAEQKRQQRLFLDLKVRLQFIGERPDCALAGFSHQTFITRLRSPLTCLRQSERGVMLPR
ncbi:MAG: hypothetical protein Q8L50_15315 [Polaromonas sp.]|nr:hypothetical protein [Polaromonas sp.]MDP1742451.1 hypothetical protein [Polaromonas sp.]